MPSNPREAVGPEGQVVPQQWLARTSAFHVDPADRRRLVFVAYGATPLSEALCCDVTLLAPLTREGRPQPSAAASRDGAAITVAERRKRAAYPELLRPGPQRLCVLACEVGGRWSSESLRLVTQIVRLRAQRAPAALCPAARQGWLRRWGFLERGFAKHTCCHAARGAVRRWRTAWCPAPAAGGHTARRSPSHPKPPRPVVRRLRGDPDFLSCKRQKGVCKKTTQTPSPTPDMHGCVSQKSSRSVVYMGVPKDATNSEGAVCNHDHKAP